MKKIAYALVVCFFFLLGIQLGFRHGRQLGWYDGNRYADKVCEEKIAWRVEDQVRDTRRVQKIREDAAYRRGFSTCQEQF